MDEDQASRAMDVHELDSIPLDEWPPGAADQVRRVLMDRKTEPEDRLQAVKLASNHVVMNDEVALYALGLIDDPAQELPLRAAAVELLEEVFFAAQTEGLDDFGLTEATVGRVHEEVRRLFEDPHTSDLLRRKILEVARGCEAAWHIDAVRVAYHSGNLAWRVSAVRGMRHGYVFDEEILDALQSEHRDLLLAAIDAVHYDLHDAWPHLRRILHDPDADFELKYEAMMSSVDIRRYTLFDDLRHLLEGDDEGLRRAAEWTLMWAGYRGDPPSLFHGNGRPEREP